jgi:hypothetical protein
MRILYDTFFSCVIDSHHIESGMKHFFLSSTIFCFAFVVYVLV